MSEQSNETAERLTEAECPKCGGHGWSTCSDGLGSVASVAACCLSCGYLTASVVDLSTSTRSAQRAE